MSEYTTRFRAEGFDTLEAILDIARADLTQVALSTDRHRVLLVYLDGIFAAMAHGRDLRRAKFLSIHNPTPATNFPIHLRSKIYQYTNESIVEAED